MQRPFCTEWVKIYDIAMLITVIPIAIGAVFGAVTRYYITSLLSKTFDDTFPVGVLICNVLGAFLLGIFMEMGTRWFSFPPSVRLGVITGFLGSFTTFSAFSLQTFLLFSRGQILLAFVYIVLSVTVTLLALYSAILIVRGW